MPLSIGYTSPTPSNTTSNSASNINKQQEAIDKQQERLASAIRINRAADDPAGLQISNRLTSEINSATQSAQNSQNNISVNNIQSAQLGAINDGLERASTLAVQAGNPLADSSAIQGELDQITEQVNAIAGEALGDDSFLAPLDATNPQATQDALATATETVAQNATAVGANTNALESQVTRYQRTAVNLSESRSRIQDTDFAEAVSEQAKSEALFQTAIKSEKDEQQRKGLFVNQAV